MNRHLERMGETVRIDYCSHAARGLPELPTVHEGVTARTMERKGYTSDCCELNLQIKADNALLRAMRRQMERIAKAVQDTIPAIARALEALWQKLLMMLRYQVIHYRSAAWQAADDLRNLTQSINTLAEELEDLRTEKNRILASFDLIDDKNMAEIRRWTKQ